MLHGMSTAAAGMAAQQLRLDALASDLANASTTGYKPTRIAFRDLVYDRAPRGVDPASDAQLGTGTGARIVGRSAQQGAIQQTGEPLDVALGGPGYLAVRLPDGREALTRSGHLQTDAQNRVVTVDGHQTGVTLPAGAELDRLQIDPRGVMTLAGREVGRLRLVDVPAPGGLAAGPGSTFVATPESGPVRAAGQGTTLTQRSLEASAVDLATAMTQLIEAQRSFQLASKAIETQDQLLGIANGIKR
jgi:flagellar basal-body rod protein FlgG